MTDWRQDRVGAALRGDNPAVLRRLRAGFAVMGDVQFLPGYCVLITDTPGVDRLTDLPRRRRADFLARAHIRARPAGRSRSRLRPSRASRPAPEGPSGTTAAASATNSGA